MNTQPSSLTSLRRRRISTHQFDVRRFARWAQLNAAHTAQQQLAATLPSTGRAAPHRAAREPAIPPSVRRPSGLAGRIIPAHSQIPSPSPGEWAWPDPVPGPLETGGGPLGDSGGPLGMGGGPLEAAPGGGPSYPSAPDGGGPLDDLRLGSAFQLAMSKRIVGLGYHADLPDVRDHSFEHQVLPFLANAGRRAWIAGHRTPLTLDPQEGFLHLASLGPLPAVENQGAMSSCTAHAVIGMAELLIYRYLGKPLDLSRLFLYKCTRRLLGWTGDPGAFLRTTIKALRLFGSLPEERWPYEPAALDDEPDAFIYAYAHSFRALEYARLDQYGNDGQTTLNSVKRALEAGHPVAFGFPVFSSIADLGTDYVIPVPKVTDNREGGHAVMVVGYNDAIPYRVPGEEALATGALIIRNSWGPEWGDQGYAYLPYWYVLQQMAVDFWTLYGLDWLDELQFEFDPDQARAQRRGTGRGRARD